MLRVNTFFYTKQILTTAGSPQPRSSSWAGPRGKVGELDGLGGPLGRVGEGLSGELDLEERPEERANDFEESLKIPQFRMYHYGKHNSFSPRSNDEIQLEGN